MIADTLALLGVDFVRQSLIAAALLGVVSGVMAPLIVMRRMSFSVHSTSELALMGASGALLFGLNVGFGAIAGAVVAAVVLGLLGTKRQDATVGVVLSFGMGLSVLFIHLYPGNSNAALSLLTGQIVGVRSSSVWALAGVTAIVLLAFALWWRPLLFAATDPIMAKAMGVPLGRYNMLFAVLVGLVAAQSVQIVGALLVMALLITPGAAAVEITDSPRRAVLYSLLFAEVAAVGGLVLSLAPGLPVSVLVTSVSFAIYLVCRGIGWARNRRATKDLVRYAHAPTSHCHPERD
ncbi:metal ABC transporter permease [Corynebacterium sp. 153RC1]|uniref:metal ABC transporter permease n=1 Tax=unclassified Corynebacterium TaxID=2624378 RepID=UPI00211CAC24|nr:MULTISPECIES: metal ABC transporter permease [unclassified Corynebacterium]MCQ9371485.1 metal ABC transporter permease [Corynebacterium sp. 35RC1]MCQ9353065.1 metal ABC transporter permease [Corynebacterium sp. 209RC1]MCQ9355269.1 metal ABC transporter permease [Corynebacterium sp. 1222RC1]MCQ9357557.1 metal ABC transporter permease [Corynebacterium sp. 122RC1]MCQ9359134.1 metal ABC transporter permease [Corynebacterium sp. 142RC1]